MTQQITWKTKGVVHYKKTGEYLVPTGSEFFGLESHFSFIPSNNRKVVEIYIPGASVTYSSFLEKFDLDVFDD